MSAHHYRAQVDWQRGEQHFLDQRYKRTHRWTFDGGIEIRASAATSVVPLPYSDEDAVDPEEAFVASLSSCHMLWFLSIAAKRGFRVDHYDDQALGVMDQDARGRISMTEVTLNPKVLFSGDKMPSLDDIRQVHEAAHEACFIANSVRAEVSIDLSRQAET